MASNTPAGRRRVAVTGAGVVAPCGIGKDAFWAGLLREPQQGLRRIEDWDPSPWFNNPKEIRRADRFEQFAVAAAAEALEQSGRPTGDLEAQLETQKQWLAQAGVPVDAPAPTPAAEAPAARKTTTAWVRADD